MHFRIACGVAAPLLMLACSAPGEQEANAQSLERKGPPAGLALPPPDVGAEEDPVTPSGIGAGIAPAYRGEWNADRGACGTPGGEMRLRVEEDVLRFHESVAKVLAVKPAGPRAIEIETSMSGEGETRKQALLLTLSPDGATLAVEIGGTRAERVRCP